MGIFDKFKKKKIDKEVSKNETAVEIPVKKAAVKVSKIIEGQKKETAMISGDKTSKAKTSLQSRANFILLQTLVSEKATIAEGYGVYTFVVNNKTNKLEVKKAVKEIYGVVPKKVRIINIEGGQTRFGNRFGRRSDWKKAIITLPKGKTINIHEGV